MIVLSEIVTLCALLKKIAALPEFPHHVAKSNPLIDKVSNVCYLDDNVVVYVSDNVVVRFARA
jgi:hypothetical protein